MSMIVEEIDKNNATAASPLLLESLEIKGYRCFEHLTIEKLGRVNLFVGRNNVGKTALLEALWIYLNRGSVFGSILASRYEDRQASSSTAPSGTLLQKALFYRDSDSPMVSIGVANSGTAFIFDWQLDRGIGSINIPKGEIRNVLVGATGIDGNLLVTLWDKIELTEQEDDVKRAMKIISDDLLQVRLRVTDSNQRIPFAQLRGVDQPMPLKSFGEGLNRLFGLALALVNCRNGVLLVDEIEGGFHYSILPDVWKLIFKTAKELNVQVFATTHSRDCIEAFADAAIESPEDGNLIRLERHDTKIVAKTIDEKLLIEAVNFNVEVR